MLSFLTLFMVIANAVAAALVYFSQNKNWETKRRVTILMIVFGVMYLLISILYLLSSIGIDTSKLPDNAKTLLISAFVPVNIIVFIPFLIRSYVKVEERELGEKKFENRAKLAGVIFIIVIIMEFFTLRSSIKNIFNQYEAQMEKRQEQIENTQSTTQNKIYSNSIEEIEENTNVVEYKTYTNMTKQNSIENDLGGVDRPTPSDDVVR